MHAADTYRARGQHHLHHLPTKDVTLGWF